MGWKGTKGDCRPAGYKPAVYDYSDFFDKTVLAVYNSGQKYLKNKKKPEKGTYTNNKQPWGKRASSTVDLISVHCTAGGPDCKYSAVDSLCKVGGSMSAWYTGNASSTFWISGCGDVVIMCKLQNRPFTTSSSSVDTRAYTFEISSESDGDIRITDYAINAFIDTVVWLIKSGKMKTTAEMKWKGDKNAGLSSDIPKSDIDTKYSVRQSSSYNAKFIGNPTEQNIVFHRWFATSGKICPGFYIAEKMGSICDTINKLAFNRNTNYKQFDETNHPKVSSHNTWTYSPSGLNFNSITSKTGEPVVIQNEPYTPPVVENTINPTVAVTNYTVTQQEKKNDDGTTETTEVVKNSDGSTTVTVTIKDKNGNVISKTENKYEAPVTRTVSSSGTVYNLSSAATTQKSSGEAVFFNSEAALNVLNNNPTTGSTKRQNTVGAPPNMLTDDDSFTIRSSTK